MKKTIKKIIQIIIFFSVGIGIFWLVYRKQDMAVLKNALLHADYFWIIVSLFLGILSHISRAMRWNLLIYPLGYKPKVINSFFSVMIMYLSNMAIPRSGEIVRCGVLGKTENIPVSKLLGTVFTERIIDFILLFILLAIVLMTQMHVVLEMLEKNPEINSNLNNLLSSTPILAGIFVLFIVLLFVLYRFKHKIQHLKIYQKLRDLIKGFAAGIKSILKMERRFEFIAHSVFIWVMYFMMIYIVFKSFHFTENLSLLSGLTVFVMSAFGMVAPSPGGIGTWHFMVIQTLMIYGVTKSDAGAFAFASHESMTILMIIVGVLSIILLPIVNKKFQKVLSKD
ncbi:MAG: flippase-like domain-containing protein [Bacteroidales bacterium]|nr:flippase-like domain-containing protein [Bacteroidales bacterium]